MSLKHLNYAAVAALILLPTSVSAQNADFSGDWEVSLSAGANQINDMTWADNASFGGTIVTGSGEVSFERGETVSLSVANRISENIGLELAASYAQSDYNSLSGTLTFSGLVNGVLSGSVPVDGSVRSISLVPNAVFYPMGENKISPYIGAGAGVSFWKDEIDSVTILGTTLSGSETGTSLTANGIVGIDFEVSDQIALGARYTYAWINTDVDTLDDPTVHNILASVKINF